MLISLFVASELLEIPSRIHNMPPAVSLIIPPRIGACISNNSPCSKIFLKISFRAWLAFQPVCLKIFKKYLVMWCIVYYLCVTKR